MRPCPAAPAGERAGEGPAASPCEDGLGLDAAVAQLLERGFALVRLTEAEVAALEAAEQECRDLLRGPRERKDLLRHRGPPRHPRWRGLPLHGAGFVSTPAYGGREQFHYICGAADVCPWPSDDWRATFEKGSEVLQERCLALVQRLDPAAATDWRMQAEQGGDPSVCDAFLYPSLSSGSECAPAKDAQPPPSEGAAARREAMGRHFDPGWLTIKKGSLDGGLEVWDRRKEAWVNAEDAEFYAAHNCQTPTDVAVVFAGERFETWTEGAVPAVPHRVLSPAGGRDRLSFIFELRDHAC